MKKILIVMSIVILPVFAIAAPGPPANNSAINTAIAAMTVDSQHTATNWEVIDSMIIAKTDTCYTYYSFVGSVTLDPGQKLYIGFAGNGTTVTIPADTTIYEWSAKETASKSFNVGIMYLDSLISQTDKSDTVVVWGAIKGSTNQEKVTVSGQLVGVVVDID